MIDIGVVETGKDLTMIDSIVYKAGNVLGVQLGALTYAPTFGVDQRYFVTNPIRFQNESFQAYLVERLIQNQVNVAEVTESLENLLARYTFRVSDAGNENTGGLIL